ncbi:MAG: nucleic acid-binding protein, partial [Thermoplasmata archaeon]|nr:nucleic acid-binding protein [Thermoplasmata archaeon]
MLVLDTSALFTMDAPPDEDYVCPPGVIKELKRYDDPRLDLWGDLLRISECSKESLAKVEEAAKRTGDDGRLSPVDRTVLALALDVNGTILSDDYSIQNVARVMGLEFRPVGTSGIKKVAKWNYRCLGCGKWYKETMP